jgi:hypothetical protein
MYNQHPGCHVESTLSVKVKSISTSCIVIAAKTDQQVKLVILS